MSSDPNATGLFVVPIEAFMDNSDVGYCFDDIQIGHNRGSEGYVDTWYDCINCGPEYLWFSYEATTNSKGIYFTVETYSYNIIPTECSSTWYGFKTPYALLDVYYGDENPWKWFLDSGHSPIMVSSYNES